MTKNPVSIARSLMRFRGVIRRLNPDVVNSHLVHANILTRLLRIATPIRRLVTSAHNTNEGGRARMLAYRLTDALADVSTNVSSEAVQAFVDQNALRRGRMVSIPNGIDTQAFVFDPYARQRLRGRLLTNCSTPVLLSVGRLCEQKDHHNLLYALVRLKQMGQNPSLLIAGEGPLRGELVQLAASLKLDSQVQFLGVRNDISDLMSACDVFVLSSAWEGFGLVVAEAMACQRVVVATDCGGVREVAGDVGFLLPPRDSDSLADALRRALTLTAEARQELGRRGRDRVIEFYSMEATAERYLAVFRGEFEPI